MRGRVQREAERKEITTGYVALLEKTQSSNTGAAESCDSACASCLESADNVTRSCVCGHRSFICCLCRDAADVPAHP